MTMLDRMRRHKSWLKWSLGVVVAAFVFLYVPQFLTPTGTTAAGSDVMATVDGEKILAETFSRAYNQQVARIRASYGQITDDTLRQLQIGSRLFQQLVSQEAVVAEARRMGITVTDGELRERLMRMPEFQANGQFIGYARYQQMLDSSRPPMRTADFEASLRRDLLAEKLQASVTGWVRVTDAEIEQEFRNRNEKVKLDVAVFNAAQFRASIAPTDAEIASEFAAHPETFRTPEKRRVRYLSVDANAMRDTMAVTPVEVEARYRENAATYSTPEQVRASHILLKTEGKDEATVRKAAEAVLSKVKAGGDFAALAKQYSEDGSKDQGGDLDFFGKGAMVPEFEQAAWGMKVGETSELVKSQFGFHIIKLTDRRAATTRTLDQVRTQIADQIKAEKAQAEANRLATEIATQIKAPADLDKVAKARNLTVGDSGLFSREEPLAGLGYAPGVTAEAFRLEKDKVSGQIRTSQGWAFIAVAEIAPPATPKLEDAKEKVREAVITKKALDLARAKAEAVSRTAGAGFAAAAKAAGVTVKSTDLITRGAALPDVGISDKVDQAAFALKAGETSAPIQTPSAIVVVTVRERKDIEPAVLDAQRDALRAELTDKRRQEFFQAYMTKAMEKITVKYNEETINKVLGS